MLGYGFLFLQTEGLSQEARTLTAAKEKLAPLLKRIDEDERERNDLEPRLKTLTDAQKLTGRWGRIMAHMATNTPRGAWLTGVRCSAEQDQPVSISLAGVGQDQSEAAEFMMRLQNAADLENVQLNFTQEKMLEKTSAIEFEVGADIVGTEPPVKAEEKKA
ncbi:hypothetical protein EON77_14875 [bacterium]|nr:MAG: hypothetical protein EON77_14875 [bacterium]